MYIVAPLAGAWIEIGTSDVNMEALDEGRSSRGSVD